MNTELINKVLGYLNSAEAFASKEVPVYIEELLQFYIVKHLVDYFFPIIFFAAAFLLVLFFLTWVNKKINAVYDDEYNAFMACWAFLGGLMLCLLVSMFRVHHLTLAYKAYKAPRVYLIDHFRDKK